VRVLQGYLVLVEDAGNNVSAYAPDLPGCVATGATVDETLISMREAITSHLEGCARVERRSRSRARTP